MNVKRELIGKKEGFSQSGRGVREDNESENTQYIYNYMYILCV